MRWRCKLPLEVLRSIEKNSYIEAQTWLVDSSTETLTRTLTSTIFHLVGKYYTIEIQVGRTSLTITLKPRAGKTHETKW